MTLWPVPNVYYVDWMSVLWLYIGVLVVCGIALGVGGLLISLIVERFCDGKTKNNSNNTADIDSVGAAVMDRRQRDSKNDDGIK